MRVKCPTCKRELEWSDAFPFRPFCSERCKMVDLGAWVAGERTIAGEPGVSPDDEAIVPDGSPHGSPQGPRDD